MTFEPFESTITVTGEENFAGVTPFEDRDGSRWYGVRRFDFWFMLGSLVCAVVIAAVTGFGVGKTRTDRAWQEKWDSFRDFADRFSTDSWTDDEGVYHDVVRQYAAHDYDLILQYESKFKYETVTNLYRRADDGQ